MSPDTTERSTHTVSSADGATIDMQVYRQRERPEAPVLIVMPAMGTRGSYYRPLADVLAGAGFHVVLGELRGQGTSSVSPARGVQYGYHEMVTLDYPALFTAVKDTFPTSRRYLVGHSLGGQLGMLYLGQEPHMADGAILVATPSCHHKGWAFPGNLKVLFGFHAAFLVGSLWGYFPGRRIGVFGDDSTNLLRDLAAQSRSGEYRVPSSSIDFESALGDIALPILAVTVQGDSMAPAGGVDGLCRKLRSAQITRWNLTLDRRGKRNPHYSWIHASETLAQCMHEFCGAGSVPETPVTMH